MCFMSSTLSKKTYYETFIVILSGCIMKIDDMNFLSLRHKIFTHFI